MYKCVCFTYIFMFLFAYLYVVSIDCIFWPLHSKYLATFISYAHKHLSIKYICDFHLILLRLPLSLSFVAIVVAAVSHAPLIAGIVLDECVDNVTLNFVNRCPLVAALQPLLMLGQHKQLLQFALEMRLRLYL